MFDGFMAFGYECKTEHSMHDTFENVFFSSEVLLYMIGLL